MDDNIFNRLQISINKTYYTTKRYNIPSTFALMYHHKALTPQELGAFVRQSDHFIKIDENHYFINFMFTEQNNAFKASQNLIFSLDKYFNDIHTAIAIDTFDESNSPRLVYNRLKQILQEIKQDSYSRIEDENILNGVL